MDLRQAIYARRAVRSFTHEPVDEATIRELIGTAIQAPSAVNQQPWLFYVVRDKAMLAKISQGAKEYLRITRPAIASPRYQELLSNPDFDIFYDAPVLILICAMAQGPWVIEDCSLAAENMMLGARGANLGTCWIGFAQGWLGTPEGKAALGLAPECVPVAPIIVGHPKTWPPPVPRKEPEIRWIGT